MSWSGKGLSWLVPREREPGEKEVVFTGGLRWQYGGGVYNLSWPLARMTVAPGQVSIRSRWPKNKTAVDVFAVQLLLDTTTILRAESARGALLFSPGVRLVMNDGTSLVFWSYKRGKVLDELERAGISVDRNTRVIGLIRH